MGNATMTTQLTPAKALEIAKNCEDGSVPASVTAVLERAINELWQRIQAQPSTYVMNKEEFIVFNYYRSRFANAPAAQQAVARFWNNFQGDTTEIEGSPAGCSPPGGQTISSTGQNGIKGAVALQPFDVSLAGL